MDTGDILEKYNNIKATLNKKQKDYGLQTNPYIRDSTK